MVFVVKTGFVPNCSGIFMCRMTVYKLSYIYHN